jgi:hypothetical protein
MTQALLHPYGVHLICFSSLVFPCLAPTPCCIIFTYFHLVYSTHHSTYSTNHFSYRLTTPVA